MKNDLALIVLSVAAVSLFAAAEELCPKMFGAGMPFLLSSVLYFSSKRPLFVAVPFAIVAGAAEDAVSSLPFVTAMSFFAMAAFACALLKTGVALASVFFPAAFQLWLWIWEPSIGNGVFARVLVSVPAGLFTAFAASAALSFAERKGGLDAA